MLIRQPVAAGRFYPGDSGQLRKEVNAWLGNADPESGDRPFAMMLPHAGYIFCGSVIGQTMAGQNLPSRLIILCPNHTGRGKMFSVWPQGEWLTPLGPVEVDAELARELIDADRIYEADTMAHIGEHSIEVLLPFLQMRVPDLRVVPICVGTQNPQILAHAASILAKVLKSPQNSDVGLIVSSDMNHYEDEKTTILKDERALNAALAGDPDALLKTVRENKISMCGAGPMALALYTARDLGKPKVEFVAHDTSAKAAGDYAHTVGYAGLRMYLTN